MFYSKNSEWIQNTSGLVSGFLKSEKTKEFNELKDDTSRINFLSSNQAFWPLLQKLKKDNRDCQGKDKQISKSLRDAGNECFKKNEDGEALDFYNQAILLAPCSEDGISEDLAIALANRGAVLLRQEKFTHCLDDLNLAEKSGYPVHLRYKILQRHGYTLSEMFRFKEAEEKYSLAIEALKESKLNSDQKDQVKQEIKKSLVENHKKPGLEQAVKDFMKNPQMAVPCDMRLDKLSIQSNKDFPSLSNLVDVNNDSEKGIFVRAASKIPAGNVVALDAPLAHLLSHECLLTHCCHCVKPVVLPVPCVKCINIIFCSESCRDEGWKSYHKLECSLLDASSKIPTEIKLAFRAFCRFYHTNTQLLQKEIKIINEILGNNDTNEKLAIMATVITLVDILKGKDFFSSSSSEGVNQEQLAACDLLYGLVKCCLVRAQPLSEVESWEITRGLELNNLGLALYPILSTFQHSCDPNTVRCSIGTSAFLITVKNIPENDPVTFSFGVRFQDKPLLERESILWKTFRTKCACKPCTENWPTGSGISNTVIKKGMEKFVPDLKKNFAAALRNSQKDMQDGYFDRVFTTWASYYENLERVVQAPHQGFLRIAREVETAAWLKYGNHRPKLKAPVYKNHQAIKDSDDDCDSDETE